jgi:Predicted exporters of the RND superfamily
MQVFFKTVANAINRRPLLVAGVVVGLLIVSLIGASMTTMETGMDTYVDENTERGMLLQKYVENFQSDSVILLVEADNVFTPDILAYVDRLERELAEERYVTGVTSITDLLKAANGGALPTSYAEIDQARGRLPPASLSSMSPSPTMMLAVVGVEPGVSQEATFSMLDSMNARIGISSPPTRRYGHPDRGIRIWSADDG